MSGLLWGRRRDGGAVRDFLQSRLWDLSVRSFLQLRGAPAPDARPAAALSSPNLPPVLSAHSPSSSRFPLQSRPSTFTSPGPQNCRALSEWHKLSQCGSLPGPVGAWHGYLESPTAKPSACLKMHCPSPVSPSPAVSSLVSSPLLSVALPSALSCQFLSGARQRPFSPRKPFPRASRPPRDLAAVSPLTHSPTASGLWLFLKGTSRSPDLLPSGLGWDPPQVSFSLRRPLVASSWRFAPQVAPRLTDSGVRRDWHRVPPGLAHSPSPA